MLEPKYEKTLWIKVYDIDWGEKVSPRNLPTTAFLNAGSMIDDFIEDTICHVLDETFGVLPDFVRYEVEYKEVEDKN